MEGVARDLKYALRSLLSQPGFTLVAVLSLALGIGANTAIFTVVNAVFLHPLAIDDPSTVAELFTLDTKTVQVGNFNLTPTSIQNFQDYRDRSAVFSGLAGYSFVGLRLAGKGDPEPIPGMMTTANYFGVLGIKPALGRLFLPDEDLHRTVPVAVLSYSAWVNRFGREPGVIGRSITLNGIAFTVVGVTQEGFKGTFALSGPDWIWVPLGMRDQLFTGQTKTLITNRRFRWLGILGRLKPGVGIDAARPAMKVLAASLAQEYPNDNGGRTIEMAPISDSALGINNRAQFVRAGGVMMAIVGLVLLIACVNVANLLLAQSARREKDIAVRSALGASRGRVVRQLLIESLVLSVAGGACGLVVAWWARNGLWAFRPPMLATAAIDLSLDRTVLAFTAGVSLLTGLVFGLAPAIRLSRANLVDTLKLGGRSGALGAGRGALRNLLVVSEVALATVALVGSGLFVRSLHAAQTMDVGFDAAHLAMVGLNPGGERYDEERGQQFYVEAIEAARQVRGVRAAAVASIVPLAGGNGVLLTVFPEGYVEPSTSHGTLIPFDDVSPGYFGTIGVPFREGRDFTAFDRADAAPIAIVNEAVARQLWPGQPALHKRFTIVQSAVLYEVVGIVADSVFDTVGEDPVPVIYRPLRQEYAPGAALLVRTTGDPAALLGALRTRIKAIDPHMPLRNAGTIAEQVEQNLWAPRMGAALLGIFGLLALVLAAVGIYGVMAYAVTLRTQEIGFRLAIGAQRSDVLQLVVGQGMVLALTGLVVGLGLSVALGRLIAQLLFGIRPHDPVTLAGVALVLGVVALVACLIPARRATRVDPMVALRSE
jgi:putative ABC transport system permease protein